MTSVFDYMDYRSFLRDRFSELKRKNPRFSYRAFNRLAGIKSSAFLKLVSEGKRNLADDGIAKIIRGFRLSETEARHFWLLVRYNQAKNVFEREIYAQLIALSQGRLGLNESIKKE